MNKIEEILSAAKLDELKDIAKVGDLLSKKEADGVEAPAEETPAEETPAE